MTDPSFRPPGAGHEGWLRREIKPADLVTWGLILFGVVGAYFRLDARVDRLTRDVETLREATALAIGELKSADAAALARLDAQRDGTIVRQESLIREIGQLRADVARTNAILERLEKSGAPK